MTADPFPSRAPLQVMLGTQVRPSLCGPFLYHLSPKLIKATCF